MKKKTVHIYDKNLFLYDYEEVLSVNLKKLNKSKNVTKINLSSSYTSNYFIEFLKIFLANKDIDLNINNQFYGDLIFNINDNKSKFWSEKCDFYILLPDSSILDLSVRDLNKNQIRKKIIADGKKFIHVWKKIKKPLIQSLFNQASFPNLALNDSVNFKGSNNYINLLNQYLIQNAPTNVTLIDLEFISKKYDITSSFNYRLDSLIKQPLSMEFMKYLANEVSNHINGILGRSKKVIVVDLDNTIWGGVVGDVGWNNIKLGGDTLEGQSFVLFQRYLKSLVDNGILLCVVSKNDEKIAKEVFKKNKNMELKLSDIILFKANYLDKATNIKNISQQLNLNLNSFVFIDDNKVECELVEKTHKEVTVINMSRDPHEFVQLLNQKSLFYFSSITNEDKSRLKSYKVIGKIQENLKKVKNIDSFLKSLKPQMSLRNIDKNNIERVLQLFSKTNQFKLNKNIFNKRFLIDNPKKFKALNFRDKFQNYGIMSALAFDLNKKKRQLEILNWVLSCRVFSRKIEFFLLKEIYKLAKNNNLDNISFDFINSGRNQYLISFLSNFGLKLNKNGNYKIKVEDLKKYG